MALQKCSKNVCNAETIFSCRTSEEFAHESGIAYSSEAPAEDELARDANHESLPESSTGEALTVLPRPRTQANGAYSRASNREAAEASLCRNSLFPNVVKQQSRCMSVLLQQGPHGGIRRIGPLLITQERGGGAIKHLNPSFIDMMDVQPVDASTAAFLKRSNIRRRSFSMPPNGPGGDWLNSLSNIISGSGGSKRGNDSMSAGPGMWWPLNDDNCSDEVSHEVHVSSQDGVESGSRAGHAQQPTLERMGSSSTIASVSLKPPPVLGAPRKGSVSSQLRLMTRADSSQAMSSGGNGSYLRSNASQSSLANHVPSLAHTTSDASDLSTSSVCAARQQPSVMASNGLSMHATGTQLADVTMRTESGVITRSIKCMSLRLLVNRLASPEGNADSDLMTDFLNSYRFFAHPIDVMRLIIARYLNCFATGTLGDDTDDSEVDDAESCVHDGDAKFLTINGWRDNAGSDAAVGSGDQSALPAGCKGDAKQAPSRQLPPLARNDGAIVQLRVMNIVKYWIKFHPHDFRLHHRLTRLLLLFLSHIQKQPGRAEFVNAIRQRLSSGKLLAVEMPAFASTHYPPGTSLSTAVSSQASSMRSSGVRTSTLEHTRSALDLRTATTQQHGQVLGSSALSRPEFTLSELRSSEDASQPVNGGHLHASVSLLDMHGQPSVAGSAARHLANSGPSSSQVPAAASGRGQQAKKGSASYFKSLFHTRSSRGSTGASGGVDAGNDTEVFGGLNAGSVRIAQRDNCPTAGADLAAAGEADLRIPNGDMFASDFGSLVMDALTKSGIPTPQTPVGRTLLNYSIANRNPYRVNLVGIDPATFAEQLTLLEHELFARISATEFSLKGRVGNLETILHTMQGVAADSRSSVSTLGGSGGGGGSLSSQNVSTNPVPNLTAMTSWFNQATYWAVLAVLSEPTSAARALVIKQLVHVAFHCLARRNYYGAFEIVIALDNSAVRRLHGTWALVPVLMKDIVARLLQVLQSRMNFRTYRESVKAAMAGVPGPDEEVFDAISDQIKSIRAKDMVSASQANIVTSNGISSATSTGHSAVSAGFGYLVHGALFGNGNGGDEGKHHMRKKSLASVNTAPLPKDAGQLTEQDCACITYAIRIRAASFMYFDPSTSNGPSGHSSVPVSSSSKGGRSGGGHLSSGSSSSKSSGLVAVTGGTGPVGASGGHETSEARSRRARSTSNSSNGAAGGRTTPTFRNGQMITNGAPLPLVPFVAVHMTDLLHADEANSTYSEEHQKMRSRNPTGPDTNSLVDDDNATLANNKRQLRCDSAAISSVNQAQPLLNMQKFRLITSMFRELHLAQRTKYPYAADTMLQHQIYSAVRNIRAQTNDIYTVVQDVAAADPLAARPQTSHVSPFTRNRNDSSASRLAAAAPEGDGGDQGAFGYPLYHIAALQKSHSGASLLDTSMDWDCTDVKDNQELEQRLYMLSKWIEPQAGNTHR
ncbi:hypothetical protein GGI20_001414 [Coemansia sp. BCRC 34301]|nr:hypothetical protein GGI20_001414 [Coemansia sp. BCRC 34301]